MCVSRRLLCGILNSILYDNTKIAVARILEKNACRTRVYGLNALLFD